jgi:hypothetical protein
MTRPDYYEAAEADLAEQLASADPGDYEDESTGTLSPEAPEWDAQEQSRTVRLDDDYR